MGINKRKYTKQRTLTTIHSNQAEFICHGSWDIQVWATQPSVKRITAPQIFSEISIFMFSGVDHDVVSCIYLMGKKFKAKDCIFSTVQAVLRKRNTDLRKE